MNHRTLVSIFLLVVLIGTVIPTVLYIMTKRGKISHTNSYDIDSSESPHSDLIKVNVDTSFLTDDFLQNNRNGSYPMPLPCPYVHLRRTVANKPRYPGNTSATCVLHKSSTDACNYAASYFHKPNEKLDDRKCDETSYPAVCTFHRTKSNDWNLTCDEKVCKSNTVTMATVDSKVGVVKSWESIGPFNTESAWKFVQNKIQEGHMFCFIKCGSIFQVLEFPPKILINKSVELHKRINVNIIVIDSISRAHFYRMMRKTVDAMRTVVYDQAIKATVLDFELFQSISMHTFDNIRPLFSGIVQGKKDFGSVMTSLAPVGIQEINDHFKKLGYQTMFQEDACWHDGWGVILNNLLRSNGAVNENTWKRFKETAKKHNLDSHGLTHFSCEVFKKYGLTNYFDRPSQVCLNGKFISEYFINNVEKMIKLVRTTKYAAPLMSYLHINSGHTDTGSRIRNEDNALAAFVLNMARDPNTLTIILSDHGHTRTGYGQSDEGKRELYGPLHFMIVPHQVAGLLGKQRMAALVNNQRRLCTTLDIHKALMTLYNESKSTDYKVSGLFSVIPPTRKCDDINLLPMVRCQCEGSETKADDNSNSHRWLAEFALGTLNNVIQRTYSKSINKSSSVLFGFGNCVRLVGKSFRQIIQSVTGSSVTFTLHVDATKVGLKEDEIFTVGIELKGGDPTLKTYDRITLYNKFKTCADTMVEMKLCVCDKRKTTNNMTILDSAAMKAFVSTPMFDTTAKIKDLQGGCLFQITRQHKSGFSIVYEIANSCVGQKFRINVSGSLYYVFTSRSLPFDITVEPNSIYFLFSATRQILNNSYMDIRLTASKL